MAESQQLKLQVKGLYTHPNNLSEVPEGSLEEAENVVIDREGIVEARRGQVQYHSDVISEKAIGLFEYKDYIFEFHTEGTIEVDDDPNWRTLSTTHLGPSESSGIIHTTKANKNLYMTTSEGIYKIDTMPNGQTSIAGGAKALGGTGALTGSSGFMSNNVNVAYRMVWGYKDANSNLILGSPSQRLVVTNTSGGTRDVNLTFSIPAGVTTDHFYQIYRSGESPSVSDEPNDEMYLVYEDNPTSGNITSKSFTITDNTPNDLKGATLYTSPSQEGIAQSNEQPPYAVDITSYKNHVFYANTKRKQQTTITLISVGGTLGIQNDDTISISGVTYTGKSTENVTNREFKVSTSGTPAENIESTALSLVRVINQAATNTSVYAYYVSGFDDLPGKIFIEARDFTSTVSVVSSRGGAFNPTLTNTINGDEENVPNRVYVSKIQQPESVPLYRYLDVGTADKAIKRIVGLRDSVIVFKDDGIFRISGEVFENFTVTLLDGTSRLLATQSVAPFNNQVVCFTDQGVVSVSESQVTVLSRPIESTLLSLSSSIFDKFPGSTFAVGYESARKYILYTISGSGSVGADQAFVYNMATDSWTRWTTTPGKIYQSALVAKRDDLLYQLEVEQQISNWSNVITKERKTYTLNDYADKQYGATITDVVSNDTLNYELDSGSLHPQIGWGVIQSGRTSIVSHVTQLTGTTGTIVVNPSYETWEEDVVTFYESIKSTVKTVPIHGANPGIQKQFREVTLFFADAKFTAMDVSIRNPISDIEQQITIHPVKGGTWGLFSWGVRPWGGGYGGQQPIRMLIPSSVNRTHWIDIKLESNEAFTSFGLGGMSLIFTTMSTRTK